MHLFNKSATFAPFKTQYMTALLSDEVVAELKKQFYDIRLFNDLMACQVITVNRQQQLLRIGEYIKVVPLVLSGSIRVIRNDESGKEILLYHIAAGESCALSISACLTNSKSHALAITEEETTALLVPADKVQKWMQQYPVWNSFVMTLYDQRFREMLDAFDAIAFKQMDSRLLDWLKEKQQLQANKQIIITHQQLANELGTAREVVSRLLKQLERQGSIKNHRGMIEILRLK